MMRAAESRYRLAIKLLLQPGSRVAWRHGEHVRHGRVIEASGDRVVVISDSEKRVWLNVQRIKGIGYA